MAGQLIFFLSTGGFGKAALSVISAEILAIKIRSNSNIKG